jgi:hypothetical protein
LFRHSRESGNPVLLEKPGFRGVLRLPGMTISFEAESFARAPNNSEIDIPQSVAAEPEGKD